MKPYYEENGIVIYHGNCEEILSELPKSDLLVTDPPYGNSWVPSKSRRKNPDDFPVMKNNDDATMIVPILKQAIFAIRPHCHVYIFGDWRNADLPLGGVCELIWDKCITTLSGADTPWAKQHEYITFGVRANAAQRKMNDGARAARMRKGSILRYQRPSGAAVTKHPTEKPVMLMRELIESSSRFYATVLDPFMGTGSTLVAALLECRNGIGIEIEEKYCEIAALRLEQLRRRTPLAPDKWESAPSTGIVPPLSESTSQSESTPPTCG